MHNVRMILSITTYGLRRADVLTDTLLSTSASTREIINVGLAVVEKVISETFIIAGIIAALAIIPVLFIKNQLAKGE